MLQYKFKSHIVSRRLYLLEEKFREISFSFGVSKSRNQMPWSFGCCVMRRWEPHILNSRSAQRYPMLIFGVTRKLWDRDSVQMEFGQRNLRYVWDRALHIRHERLYLTEGSLRRRPRVRVNRNFDSRWVEWWTCVVSVRDGLNKKKSFPSLP